MKLITLNTWGGQVYEPLLKFLKNHAADTDVFCFQEVLFGQEAAFTPVHKARLNLFSEIEKCLPDFNAYTFLASQEAVSFQSEPLSAHTKAGQAIFVKKSLAVTNNGGFRTYKGEVKGMDLGGKITGSCQWVQIEYHNESLLVLNLHGLWQKDTNKQDTPERLEQSNIINKFLSEKSVSKILCGDFNLRPDGQSIKILEKHLINLIKKFNITTTRSCLYTKPEKFADYILTSPSLGVKEFHVLSEVVSDHLPLLVKISALGR